MSTNLILITKKFEEIGARVKFNSLQSTRSSINIRIDIQHDRKGDYFFIESTDEVDLSVPDIQKIDRHLLLFTKDPELQRFLCGHDERNWFVAAIPESSGASNVKEAKESLKPDHVRYRKQAKRRSERTRVRRQGEWFFIPRPNMEVLDNMILKNEPIARTRGTPHMVEELYRRGGTTTYISDKYPDGLVEKEYKKRIKAEPALKRLYWRPRRVGAQVFARGRITHRDHRTIVLQFWHEVFMNTEANSKAMKYLAFID